MVWARVRAALIALAIAVGILDGLVIPEGERAERLPEVVRPFTGVAARVREALLWPFQGVRRTFLLNQRWSLFGGAKEDRYRLWVEGRRGRREWIILYRAQDPEHRWFARGLEYRRVRAAWNIGRKGRMAGYDAFAAWVSARALSERPELSAVRVRLEKGDIAPRSGGFQPSGRFTLSTTHEREKR